MDRLRSILVGVDFSESSERALEQALRIAAWNDASIHLFHAVSAQRASYLPSEAEGRRSQLDDEPWASGEATREVVVGAPLDETLRLVDEREVDLLVIGAFGPLGEFTGAGVGVFAAQCMRHVPCKVLAVHHGLRGSFKRVLAASDFSPTADRALEAAIRLVRQESGELHLIHVPHDGEADTSGIESRLRHAVRRLDEGSGPLDVRVGVTKPTDPGEAIIRYARMIEAHLIALGSHGMGDLEYVLAGSTCERVLRAVQRSVLVAKPAGFVPPRRRYAK